ncbi:hypothetical protein [Pseudomonas veronii]
MTEYTELKRLAEAAPKVRDPLKTRAHGKVRDAILSGNLVRPSICEKCGDEPGAGVDGRSLIQGHHHKGYDRPLDVEWLCARCHRMETPFNPRRGDAVKVGKLTLDAVLDIRTKRMSQRQFAALYGVVQTAVQQVQTRRTWDHV